MPAVVRVKRRIDEEPLGAFVLNGKKRRLDDSQECSTTATVDPTSPVNLFATSKDEISTILKFAGTVQSQDENVTTQIARLTKDEATELAKKQRQQPINVTERARQEMRAQSNENRFKVVNCFRAIDTDTTDANPKEITIVDIEKQPSTAAQQAQQDPQTSTSKRSQNEVSPEPRIDNFTPTDGDGYVYDLYLPENEQQADDVDYTDNYLSIRAYDELVYEESYNNEEEEAEDSEDSNEENYFRNDYPDEEDDLEDEDGSINFRDMRRALEAVNLGSDYENELSSDEEDLRQNNRSGFVFSIDTLDDDFVDDVDYRDVDRYGTAYARYKKRILREMSNNDSDDSEYDKNEETFDGENSNSD